MTFITFWHKKIDNKDHNTFGEIHVMTGSNNNTTCYVITNVTPGLARSEIVRCHSLPKQKITWAK